MKTYLIAYDLINETGSSGYKKLIDEIKSYDRWSKPLESTWLIKTSESVSAVRDHLKDYVDEDDKLLVINVTRSGWASLRISKKVTDWIKKHL